MPTRNLSKIFEPKSIVIIGSTASDISIARTAHRNIKSGGFCRPVWIVDGQYVESSSGDVSPMETDNSDGDGGAPKSSSFAIDPHFVLPTMEALTCPMPDLAIVACTESCDILPVIRKCGKLGILGIVVLSWSAVRSRAPIGHHRTSVVEDMAICLDDEIRHECERIDGMRILGPNSLGVLVPKLRLNCSCAVTTKLPKDGTVAFISMSSRLCNAVLDWAARENVGFSHVVSLGNTSSVSIADLIDYFAAKYWVHSIVLYVESITKARDFMSAARSFSRQKPIIVYKAGRFEPVAELSTSYTGSVVASVDQVYDAAFHRAGAVRLNQLEDIFDAAELLSKNDAPRGSRLAIVTNAGGPGLMATDELLARKGTLAQLSEQTTRALAEAVHPDAAILSNPIDLTGRASPLQFGETTNALLLDTNVDAILVIFAPNIGVSSKAVATAVVGAVQSGLVQFISKPVIAVCLGGETVREAIEIYNSSGIPTYRSPEPAVRAFMNLVLYGRLKETLYETPKDVKVEISSGRTSARALFDEMNTNRDHTTLAEDASESIFQAYGIPMKKSLAPQNDGGNKFGIEFLIGARYDLTFGPVVMFGLSLGGLGGSLCKPSVELPPLTERLARGMIESIDMLRLFNSQEGSPDIHVERLVELLIRISYMIADLPEVETLDVRVSPESIAAVATRVVVNPSRKGRKRYSQLAIRPYPEELQQQTFLKDSTPVLLRPIRPEDEIEWHRMISRCSNQSKLFRFNHTFKNTSHEMAARYCFVDYDREIAIVAEVEEYQTKALVGVGRLVADVDHTTAEYAVIVCDQYQGKGLGSILTEYCTEIARRWGISTLVAETSPSNRRMLSLFSRKAFALNREASGVVICKKEITS